ncbi:3-oxoacyl-[acyl-carrier-protein] reductase [Gemmiger formicilis]|uniref:3-oxoacyl-[acyl-carrier-protein] reductase n=1 Tax=Gemmiger formicilis TaxID=745368 RepID=UPI00195BE453|nr:3-oxoacyl-[acyl-carrier-protein] reductase [Gemmiger formicilis]MBM6914917.1 3-oxoacyl-[acyl-carrier-protein] reductase [Gemmiger formicilis]
MEQMAKRALVTGGSRGIGRAVCLALAARGMRVAVNYAGNAAAAEEVVQACLQQGAPDAFAVQADVSDAEQVRALVAAVSERWGGVDVLVNNAGITRDGLMMRMSEQDFDAVLATNLKGAFACMQAVMRPMMKQRWGRIVNMSSVVGLRGNLGQANYAASKAGLIGMSKSAAKELASRGITVNCVAPGFIETDMTAVLPESVRTALLGQIPLARLGAAEEVAAAVAFLASPESAYITGQVLCVDGGMAM